MKISRSVDRDFFNTTCKNAAQNSKDLPEPLPWIEPSINMIYLESISSFLFGNYFSSIVSMSILLEHVLRLAICDKENSGLNRNVSIKQLDKIGTISGLITRAKEENLINDEEFPWWEKVAKIMRNKSAHFLLPTILKEFTKDEYDEEEKSREEYHPNHYKLTDKDGNPIGFLSHDWGSFFHKSDYYIAKQFLVDSTDKILSVINRTSWQPDRTWWISQEYWYESLFKFNWDLDSMKKSLQNMYTRLGDDKDKK